MKVGLCGFGGMGRTHAQLLQKHADVKLVAVADAEEERRQLAKDTYGVQTWASGEEMIAAGGLDVVFVCVPTYLHAPLTIQALRAGCDVFCEKPMALNEALCQDMIAAADECDKALMIGQVLRFWPEYVFLKKAIDSGEYGKLHTLSMTRVGGISIGWDNWYLNEDRGGMQIFDRHIHDTDAILWMLGLPRSVYAYGVHRDPHNAGGIYHSFTQYDYGDGLVVSAEGSADTPKGFPFTAAYRAFFADTCIEFNSAVKPTLKVYAGSEVRVPDLSVTEETLKSGLNISTGGPYLNEQCYFFDCLRRGVKPTTVTPASAKQTIRVVKAEVESYRARKPIML